MRTLCLNLHPHVSVEDAWKELENSGCTVLFSTENVNGASQIYAHVPVQFNPDSLSIIDSWSEEPIPEIDWEAQWALHAPGYHEGYVWIDLKEFGCAKTVQRIRLKPGPGFGDLSHPTTNLMIRMMIPYIEKRDVLDIGCGSGVLSICSAILGAASVHGIDIDTDALSHAQSNAILNHLEQKICFSFPHEVDLSTISNPLILMNMIWSEQNEALDALSNLKGDWIISGVHLSEREKYLHAVQQRGWKLIAEHQLQEWCGFNISN